MSEIPSMTKEEALKQRSARRQNSSIVQLTKHFLICDFSKLPGVDVSGKVEYGPFDKYYTQRFASDLAKYYDIDTSCGNFPYPFILAMEPPRIDELGDWIGYNKNRIDLNFAGIRHFSMFAAAVFYTTACAQVIGKCHGGKPMKDFHKASGWPMMNCGMGGLMSPIQVVFESYLYPYSPDIDEYLEVFHEAADYLEADFFDFLEHDRANLNPAAYAALREVIGLAALREELAQQRKLFEAWIQDPRTKYPLYYLEPNDIWNEDGQD